MASAIPTSLELYARSMSTAPAAVGDLLGGQLLSTVFNTVVMAILCSQLYYYFLKFRDHRLLQAVVVIVPLLHLTVMLVSYQALWKSLIKKWGNPTAATIPITSHLNIALAILVIESALNQMFFVYRIAALTRSVVLSVVSGLFVAAQVSFGIAYLILWSQKGLSDPTYTGQTLLAWYGIHLAADFVIAAIMSSALLRRQSGIEKTDSLLRKLVFLVIATGTVTTVLSLLLIVSIALQLTKMTLAVAGFYTACFPLVLLTNLHMRSTARRWGATQHRVPQSQSTPNVTEPTLTIELHRTRSSVLTKTLPTRNNEPATLSIRDYGSFGDIERDQEQHSPVILISRMEQPYSHA